MLNQALVIAAKEAVDGLRDVRSVISSLMYALMGPFVVFMVSMANPANTRPGAGGAVLIAMMSVFTLVAAFVGGMNMAMDTVAGERERRSLLPLLLNPVLRRDIVIGKWLAVSAFSAAGLGVNLLGFGAVLAAAGLPARVDLLQVAAVLAVAILPMALFAASVQMLISTVCRGVKEAHTYLSMIIFLPMGLGMFTVFFPGSVHGWSSLLPVVGQQIQLELLMKSGEVRIAETIALGCITAASAIVVLAAAANRLHRDEITYGD